MSRIHHENFLKTANWAEACDMPYRWNRWTNKWNKGQDGLVVLRWDFWLAVSVFETGCVLHRRSTPNRTSRRSEQAWHDKAMSTDGDRKGLWHVGVNHWSQWDPQMASLPQFFKSGPRGPPAASDGPSTACNVWNNWYMQDELHGQDELHCQDDQCMRPGHAQTASAQLAWHYARTARVDQHTIQTTHMARLKYQRRTAWSRHGVYNAYA